MSKHIILQLMGFDFALFNLRESRCWRMLRRARTRVAPKPGGPRFLIRSFLDVSLHGYTTKDCANTGTQPHPPARRVLNFKPLTVTRVVVYAILFLGQHQSLPWQ